MGVLLSSRTKGRHFVLLFTKYGNRKYALERTRGNLQIQYLTYSWLSTRMNLNMLGGMSEQLWEVARSPLLPSLQDTHSLASSGTTASGNGAAIT